MNRRDLKRLAGVLKRFSTTLDKAALCLWLEREFTEYSHEDWQQFYLDSYSNRGTAQEEEVTG